MNFKIHECTNVEWPNLQKVIDTLARTQKFSLVMLSQKIKLGLTSFSNTLLSLKYIITFLFLECTFA